MKVALIPARGGSKRLPGKNIKMLCGKPLIQWSIDAARASGLFDHICVSTDSEEIARVAEHCGAEVPFIRPAEMASDSATTATVIRHFIERFEEMHQRSIDYICLLQPTSPLRTAKDILAADKLLRDGQLDAVVSVCELEHPFQLCNKLGPSGSVKGFVRPSENRRAQEQEVYYRLNGAIYFCRRSIGMNFARLYDDDVESKAYIMNAHDSIDIDTKLDFQIAAALIGGNQEFTRVV